MTEAAIVAGMIILLVLMATWFGVTLLLSYMVVRMLRSDGWDKSNVTNALRVLSHIVIHPEDTAYMWYVTKDAVYNHNKLIGSRRVFPYINQDEFAHIVKTRPRAEEKVS